MTSNSTTPVPTGRLRAISQHLTYEMEMWRATCDMLGDRLWEDVEGRYLTETAKNALLEAFTLHTRTLMDFLYEEPRKDDVSARHFFTDEEWERMTNAPEPDSPSYTHAPRSPRSHDRSAVLSQARRRVGKEIAHLTYKRLENEVEGRLWPTDEIVKALATDLSRFVEQVPTHRVHDGFKARHLFVSSSPEEHQKARVHEPGTDLSPMSAATQALLPERP